MKSAIYWISFVLALTLTIQVQGQENRNKKKNKQTALSEEDRFKESDLFVKALASKVKGDIPDAIDNFNAALAIDPNDAAVYYELGRIYLIQRPDEALAFARKACELDPSNKWYLAFFANASKQSEHYEDYVNSYATLVEQYPEDIDFLYELAFAYYYTGDYANAIKAYDKVEEEVGFNEALTNQKAGFYVKLNNPEGGAAEYQKLIDTNPDDPRYYALMAEYCSKNGLQDKAIAAYEKIVEINPDDPFVHISLADFYNKRGDTTKAFDELKKGLANSKLDLQTKISLLVNYYQGQLTGTQKAHLLQLSEVLMEAHPDEPLSKTFFASMLYENGEYEKARPILKEITSQDQAGYVVWEQLLFADINMQAFDLLLVDSEEAVDYFPSYPIPYLMAGMAAFQLKDYVKAEAYLKSGIDFVVNNKPLLEQFYATLGDTYHVLEKNDAAFDAYDKALLLDPDNALVLNNYAYYLTLGNIRLDKALEMAKKAVELEPYNSNSLDTYAWVFFRMGNYSDALIWIEKAYNNGGNSSGVVLEHYGDILYHVGKLKEAVSMWQKALSMDEHSNVLTKKIKEETWYE